MRPHFLMELHVALVCGVPNAPWLEYIPQLDELTVTDMAFESGRATPAVTPGHGIHRDNAALATRAVAAQSFVID